MIQAIIFDMDGVLVDSEPFHSEVERRQFVLNGIAVSEEEHQQYMGTATDVMWRQIASRHQLPLSVEELIEQNRNEAFRFFTDLAEIPVMPGLFDLLEKLQAKDLPIAVASSSYPEIIELILFKSGLQKYFQVVVSSQEAGKSKPEPDVFLLAAQKLGIHPENCMVVEDSKNGIKAAHAAGMRCIAFQGPGTDPKKQKEADAIIKHFSELERFLKKPYF